MKWVKRITRFVFVTGGIVFLTSLGIDASQYLAGSQSALGTLADRATEGRCPAGMVQISQPGDDLCVDIYEVSPSSECPTAEPAHISQTATNIQTAGCIAVSEPDRMPWRYVSYHQAKELCAKAGKRLPTNAEWHQAALGTVETTCVVDETAAKKTGVTECVSGYGVNDMVGNVWEWIDGEVIGGAIQETVLPESGYVQVANDSGVPVFTDSAPSEVFHKDYFWASAEEISNMMRGGFYSSGSDAGIYSLHSGVVPNFAGAAIGFRCVQ